MKWQKLGQIFEAEQHDLDFAKSPQAVVFPDYVRVYFSTCRPDGEKLVSSAAFIDFDYGWVPLGKVETDILPPAGLGCFDEHGIFPLSPLCVGNEIHAYTTGWSRRKAVSVDTAIGLVISRDNGTTFARTGQGPVMASALHEPFLVADAFVRPFQGIFHMWYIFGTDWVTFDHGREPDRIYKIAHATSTDGINWRRDAQPIIEDVLEQESQALPSVIYRNGRYHMVFCYRHSSDFRTNTERGYRLGYAHSEDLQRWTRADHELGMDGSREAFESGMQCYPCFVELADELYLLYNGNAFGKYGFGAAKLVD